MAYFNPFIYISGGTTDFRSLKIGDQFHYVDSDTVYTKTTRRSFTDSQGHKWSTGAGTAVVEIR